MIDSPLVDTVHAEFEHLLMKVMLCWQKTFSQIFSTFDMDKLGKIRGHHRKERLKISIVPQSCEILQTFVRAGGGHKLAPHHANICKFSQLCGALPFTLQFGKFTNVKALFPVVLMDFP